MKAVLNVIVASCIMNIGAATYPRCSLNITTPPMCFGPFMGPKLCTSKADCNSRQACIRQSNTNLEAPRFCMCPFILGWVGADVPYLYGEPYCKFCGGCGPGGDPGPSAGANWHPYNPCRGPLAHLSNTCDVPSEEMLDTGRACFMMCCVSMWIAFVTGLFYVMPMLILKVNASVWKASPMPWACFFLFFSTIAHTVGWTIAVVSQYNPDLQVLGFSAVGYGWGIGLSLGETSGIRTHANLDLNAKTAPPARET